MVEEIMYGPDVPDDDDFDEPYFQDEDHGYGTCPECGSFLYNSGAVSEGDGDIGDALFCPNCQEQRGWANRTWSDSVGNRFDSKEDLWAHGDFDGEDEEEAEVLPFDDEAQ